MIGRLVATSAVVVVLSTLAFGVGYPLLVTGIGQTAFASQANGSLITKDGKVVGSKLVAQEFTGNQWFHERPSGVAYNAAATSFANLGPTSADLATAVHKQLVAVIALEGPYNPGLAAAGVPVDAVTTSGSGIDPDISPAYAALQSHRIAAVSGLPLATVAQLIKKNTDGRSLGFFGEPGVNVLKLNLALAKAEGH